MDFKVISNNSVQYLETFSKVLIRNAIDKQFWIQKFESLSLFQKLAIGGVILTKAVQYLSPVIAAKRSKFIFDDLKLDHSHKYLNTFLSDVMNENISLSVLGQKYTQDAEIITLGTEIANHENFRKHFQNEQLVHRIIDAITSIDEKLKARSLQEMPDHIPLYKQEEQQLPPSTASENINILFVLRGILTVLLRVTQGYKNVPLSIVEDLVRVATSKTVTFGLRRTVLFCLNDLCIYEENVLNVILANGFSVVKYYDDLQYPTSPLFEQPLLDNILEACRYTLSFPAEINTRLSKDEIAILKSEINKKRYTHFKLQLLSWAFSFYTSYYYSKNIPISLYAGIFLGSSSCDVSFKNDILDLLKYIADLVFVPNWTKIAMASCTGYMLSYTYFFYIPSLKKPIVRQYTEEQQNAMIPNISSIERS